MNDQRKPRGDASITFEDPNAARNAISWFNRMPVYPPPPPPPWRIALTRLTTLLIYVVGRSGVCVGGGVGDPGLHV